jgi:hypothetical protein
VSLWQSFWDSLTGSRPVTDPDEPYISPYTGKFSHADELELREKLEKSLGRDKRPYTGPMKGQHVVVPRPEPKRPPAFAPRHNYGGNGTLHRTSTIDVVLDENGKVCQVWFRCLELPFTVDQRDHDPGYYNPGDDGYERKIAIEEITYVDLPSEESSQ